MENHIAAQLITGLVVAAVVVTVGGYGRAGAGAVYTANDIYSNSRGYNVILDKVFDDNIEAYEAAGMVLDLFAEMYMNLGESNRALGNRSDNDAGQPGEEPPKKPSDMGDNESAVGETAKENNIKSTVDNGNADIGITKDNSARNSVESDNTAVEAIQNNDTQSTVSSKSANAADGDSLLIEIKSKKSGQDVPETDIQEDLQIQSLSYNFSDDYDMDDAPIRDRRKKKKDKEGVYIDDQSTSKRKRDIKELGDIDIKELERVPDNVIEQYGGEDFTQELKKNGGKSHADLFWDKDGNVYAILKKGNIPQLVGFIPRDS